MKQPAAGAAPGKNRLQVLNFAESSVNLVNIVVKSNFQDYETGANAPENRWKKNIDVYGPSDLYKMAILAKINKFDHIPHFSA